MASPLTALTSSLDVLTHTFGISSLSTDAFVTFGLAGGFIVAALTVLAMLPWTDQQIEATDAEARRLVQHARVTLQPRVRPVPVVVPRSS
jgi:hypothetical protein